MTTPVTRTEHDSMGPVELPADAPYGPQTQRALNNFTIAGDPMPADFIDALLLIKRAAAEANRELGLLPAETAAAIGASIDEIVPERIGELFPVPVLQTGSGTSTNMNANEVIAGLAARRGIDISPNDHVNMGQSSNDVIPSAMHIAAARQVRGQVIPALRALAGTIEAKARRYPAVVKTGRTHLMDALPIRLERELGAWSAQIHDNIDRLETVLGRLVVLPLGGTAVGSGVNCPPGFVSAALAAIERISGERFVRAKSCYQGLSSIDTVLEASAHLKTTAVSLMKIANDLRWMNSGPHSGLGEISLPALQPGSSIMPDKVNPVIPEAVCMAAAQVIGNDSAITIAAQAGSFQLNTMLPLAAAKILDSGRLVGNGARLLGDKAIAEMTVNEERLAAPLSVNPILVTSLTPYIGYLKAAEIAKKARHENRSVLEVARQETELEDDLLERLLDPAHLADGGRP